MRTTIKTLLCSAPLALLLVAGPARGADPKIERTWKAKCASCHGADGKAQTEQGKKDKIGDLTKAKFDAAKYKTAIVDGVKKDGKVVMEGYKDKLKPDQVDALVAFIGELAGKK